MVEQYLPVLAAIVGVLAVLQGWQMIAAWRKNHGHNPGWDSVAGQLTSMNEKLDSSLVQGGRMEQRLNDIWSEVCRRSGKI